MFNRLEAGTKTIEHVGCIFYKTMMKDFQMRLFFFCLLYFHLLNNYWLKSQLHNKVESAR